MLCFVNESIVSNCIVPKLARIQHTYILIQFIHGTCKFTTCLFLEIGVIQQNNSSSGSAFLIIGNFLVRQFPFVFPDVNTIVCVIVDRSRAKPEKLTVLKLTVVFPRSLLPTFFRVGKRGIIPQGQGNGMF